MFGFLTAANPAMIWGSVLIASPIIIHLLSKRRFIVVEWAAMEFLLDAQNKNRRRVQLEHLILLFLRCLAVLLIALMIARPAFDPTGLGAKLLRGRTEHIVLFDNSPSMGAIAGNLTAFDDAKKSLTALIRSLATANSGDSITILTTSKPNNPVMKGVYISNDNVDKACAKVNSLTLSNFPANYEQAAEEIIKLAEENSGNTNRHVYIITDLRREDWQLPEKNVDTAHGAVRKLKEMSSGKNGTLLTISDFGRERLENVAITAISPPEEALIAGVEARFTITIQNFGSSDVDNINLSFTAGSALPIKKEISSIPPGGKVEVPFSFTFHEIGSYEVHAEIDNDHLSFDNHRLFSAHVAKGIKTLIVDGEPSSEYGKSESFYIEKVLASTGEFKTGFDVEVISEDQFETFSLDEYRYIVLCNLYKISETRSKALHKYVESGGGLAIFLGDQCDPESYRNVQSFAPGLIPFELISIEGDKSEATWTGIKAAQMNHQLATGFCGPENTFANNYKIFQYWKLSATPLTDDTIKPQIIMAFTNTEESPAVTEFRIGKGKVALIAFPCDDEWAVWPFASRPLSMLNMAVHLAGKEPQDNNITVGEPIRYVIDPTRFALQAKLFKPYAEDFDNIQAEPLADGKRMQINVETTTIRGMYRLALANRNENTTDILFAANVSPRESNLTRVETDRILAVFDKSKIHLVNAGLTTEGNEEAGKVPLWRTLLILLVLVLCAEQFLAWLFGARR